MDKKEFIDTIMKNAKSNYNKNSIFEYYPWDYLICDNPTDIALFYEDANVDIIIKYIRNSFIAEKLNIKRYTKNSSLSIRLIDGYRYDGNKIRKPTLKEKSNYIKNELKQLHDNGILTGVYYRSQKGKLYKSKKSFQEVINFIKKRKNDPQYQKIINNYNIFLKEGIKYWDENELKHLKNPIIIETIDMELPNNPKRKGCVYKHEYYK